MDHSLAFTLGLGFLLGLKHATEADHLAAVTTIVSERRSLWDAGKIGALWGIGHTTSLMAAGVAVIGLGLVIPERIAHLLELCVAAMIILLGSRLLYFALSHRNETHIHTHRHGGAAHFHLHFHKSEAAHDLKTTHEGAHEGLSGWRPYVVGVVHGLAGSAALTILVLTEVVRNSSALVGLVYLLVFGSGSIAGMLIMSCLIGLPFAVGLRFSKPVAGLLQISAATGSILFGCYYAWHIAAAGGLS